MGGVSAPPYIEADMLIKFIEDVTVRDNSGRHYSKGCVVEMAADACRHFVVRKKAVFCNAPKVEKPAVEVEPVEAVEEAAEAVEIPAPKKSKKRRK